MAMALSDDAYCIPKPFSNNDAHDGNFQSQLPRRTNIWAHGPGVSTAEVPKKLVQSAAFATEATGLTARSFPARADLGCSWQLQTKFSQRRCHRQYFW